MVKQHFLHILEEQAAIGFTGRINILQEDGSLNGVISLYDGKLVAAQKKEQLSIEFLYTFAFDDLEKQEKFNYIIEPEVISKDKHIFVLEFSQFKRELAKQYTEYNKLKKFMPPPNISLVPKVQFIAQKISLSPAEFDLLALISEYSLVADIFEHTPFSPLRTLKLLIKLRKLGAIAVYSMSNS